MIPLSVTENVSGGRRKSHFLNGVVTGSEWLRLGFMTRGFKRICGPSDERVGNEVIGGGGGGADMEGGGGEATGAGDGVCIGGG